MINKIPGHIWVKIRYIENLATVFAEKTKRFFSSKKSHRNEPSKDIYFAVLSSVPISDALLPCRSSWHSNLWPHPRLVPHRGPAPRGPQEETSNRWWAVIRRRHCTAAESSVVFSDVFSDLSYAEHPSWRQTLATSLSHTEWAPLSLSAPRSPPPPPHLPPPKGADRYCIPPPMIICGA